MKSTTALVFLLGCGPVLSVASEGKTKVTVLVRGAHCEECVASICERLHRVKGVEFVDADVRPGAGPRFFSEPFEISVGTMLETGVGAIGKAVASAPTPHRRKVAPRLHLVLYTDFEIEEDTVSRLRSELVPINGVAVREGGGLGAFPQKRFYWIRLEPAGGADLQEILEAAKSIVDIRLLEKP